MYNNISYRRLTESMAKVYLNESDDDDSDDISYAQDRTPSQADILFREMEEK